MSLLVLACLAALEGGDDPRPLAPPSDRGRILDERHDLLREDATERRFVASLHSRLVQIEGRIELWMQISARGRGVDAAHGFEGLDGFNRRTAAELERLVREDALAIESEEPLDARAAVSRWTHPEQRRWSERDGGPVDHFAVATRPAVETLTVVLGGLDEEAGTIHVCVRGHPRIELSYRLDAPRERGVLSPARSLGTGFFAAMPPPRRRLPVHRPTPVALRAPARLRAAQESPSLPPNSLTTPPAEEDDFELIDPELWRALDTEGRWLLYRSSSGGPELRQAWIAFLIQQQEIAILEWIALAEGDAAMARHLRELGSPRWIPVAAWLSHQPDSHNVESSATQLRTVDPDAVATWFETYPQMARGHLVAVRDAVLQAAKGRVDPTGLEPPIRVPDVLGPLLPPDELPELPLGQAGTPGTVYVHGVLRALDTLVHSGLREDPWLGAVLTLARHPHPLVRRKAYLSFTRLEPRHIPVDALRELAFGRGPDAADACLAYTYGGHPDTSLRLVEVAEDPTHPAWSAAVSRLRDLGDALDARRLREHSRPPSPEAAASLEQALDAMEARCPPPPRFPRDPSMPALKDTPHPDLATLRRWIERALWTEATGHPRAESATLWAEERLREWAMHPGARKALQDLAGSYEASPHLEDPQRQRLREGVREMARTWSGG